MSTLIALETIANLPDKERDKIFAFFDKIFSNIINDPNNTKFQNLNVQKVEKKIQKCSDSIYLLSNAGFIKTDEMRYIFNKKDINKLIKTYKIFREHQKKLITQDDTITETKATMDAQMNVLLSQIKLVNKTMDILNEQNINYMSAKDRDLVFGFIRKYDSYLSQKIPYDIYCICASFWNILEEFDDKYNYGPSVKLKGSKKGYIDIVEVVRYTNNIIVFGKRMIDPMTNKQAIYEWSVKFENMCVSSASFGIQEMGIDLMDSCFLSQATPKNIKFCGYCSSGGIGGIVYSNSDNTRTEIKTDSYVNGDILKMQFHLGLMRVIFYKNGKQVGCTVSMPRAIKYKFCASFDGMELTDNRTIQLIDFKIIQP